MRSLLLLLLLLSVSLTMCTKKPPTLDALLTTHKAPVEAKLALIEKVIPRSLPRLAKEGITIEGPVKLTNLWGSSLIAPGGNAALLHADTLYDLTRESGARVKLAEADLINSCAAILKKGFLSDGTTKATGNHAERPLTICAGLRYVFVIEENDVTRPVTDEAAKSFTPGSYKGTIHAFDLDKGAAIGGVSVLADTREQATNYRGKGYGSDAVDGMFLGAVGTAIEAALSKAVPQLERPK